MASLEEEISEKLVLARGILRHLRHSSYHKDIQAFQYSILHLAGFIYCDMNSLRQFHHDMEHRSSNRTFSRFEDLEALLAKYLQLRIEGTPRRELQDSPSEERSRYADDSQIWPLRTPSTSEFRELRELMVSQNLFLSREMGLRLTELYDALDDDDYGQGPDWNSAPLTPWLRSSWGKAKVGLKWIGAEEEIEGHCLAKMQWQWLPSKIHEKLSAEYLVEAEKGCPAKATVDFESKPTLEAIKKVLVDMQREPHDARVAIEKQEHSQTLNLGGIVTMSVSREDVDNLKAVVEAQWSLLQIAALSGAAEAPNELNAALPMLRTIPPPKGWGKVWGAGWGVVEDESEDESGDESEDEYDYDEGGDEEEDEEGDSE